MCFFLATIAFYRESAQMSQILSSQLPTTAPSHPHIAPRYCALANCENNKRTRRFSARQKRSWFCSRFHKTAMTKGCNMCRKGHCSDKNFQSVHFCKLIILRPSSVRKYCVYLRICNAFIDAAQRTKSWGYGSKGGFFFPPWADGFWQRISSNVSNTIIARETRTFRPLSLLFSAFSSLKVIVQSHLCRPAIRLVCVQYIMYLEEGPRRMSSHGVEPWPKGKKICLRCVHEQKLRCPPKEINAFNLKWKCPFLPCGLYVRNQKP